MRIMGTYTELLSVFGSKSLDDDAKTAETTAVSRLS